MKRLMAVPEKRTVKPKGSGRRLYTTRILEYCPYKFTTPADARATVAKVKRVNKPFARKIQILTVMEQRSKSWQKVKLLQLLRKEKMQSKNVITRLLRFIDTRVDALSTSVTSGSVDNMEK